MSCNLTRPSPTELFAKIKDNFSANVLGGGEVIPESLEWYVVSNDYAMAEEFYSISEQQWKENDPRYACCDNLVAMAERDGVYPRPATFAQGLITLTGTPGSAIPSTLEVVFGSQHYLAIGNRPAILSVNGDARIRVQAVVPGEEGNVAPKLGNGQTAQVIAGIDQEVVSIPQSFCGGGAKEECEPFRQRYLERLAFKPRSIESWLIDKIKEWPCVTDVFKRGGTCCDPFAEQVCGCQNCYNQLNFYPIFGGSYECGLPPQCIIDEMNEWLFGTPQGHGTGQVEIGVCGRLYTAEPAMIRVKVEGLNCATAAQNAIVRERIADIFARAAPSEILTLRSIELAIGQVLGVTEEFGVEFETISGNMDYTECGDLDPPCDVRPCLGEIFEVNPFVAGEFCG